jgi:hypothetical protein
MFEKVKNYKETILLYKELRADNLEEIKRLNDRRADIQSEVGVKEKYKDEIAFNVDRLQK